MQQRILDDMKKAMRAGDKARLALIRCLRAALKDQEIALGHALSADEVIALVAKQVKQRQDAAKQYAEAERPELEAKELEEIGYLQDYLPQALSDEALQAAIDQAISETSASSMRDMGKVMAVLRPKVQGRADMSAVSNAVKASLSA